MLTSLTKKLLHYTDVISDKFAEVKESKVKGDFFAEVKPFADEVKASNDEWQNLAKAWIRENMPKHLHEKQIESTYEQIEMLSVQCFFPDTSRKRFIDYWQSVRFILNSLLTHLEKK
jgi:hypothetical protein